MIQEIILFLGLIPAAILFVKLPVIWLHYNKLAGDDVGDELIESLAAFTCIGQYFIF